MKKAKSKNWDLSKTNDPVSPTNHSVERKQGGELFYNERALRDRTVTAMSGPFLDSESDEST